MQGLTALPLAPPDFIEASLINTIMRETAVSRRSIFFIRRLLMLISDPKARLPSKDHLGHTPVKDLSLVITMPSLNSQDNLPPNNVIP